jgi:hypothetical protein
MALLPLESGDFRRDIGLFWRKTSGATDLMEQLAATITTVAGQLIGQGGAEAA